MLPVRCVSNSATPAECQTRLRSSQEGQGQQGKCHSNVQLLVTDHISRTQPEPTCHGRAKHGSSHIAQAFVRF